MGSQQYCLRWNNHYTNLQLTFDHLFKLEAFTDVTLACEGMSVKCHKVVLAACSSYFQNLFLEVGSQHPIVILKDIKFSELKTILDYMYKGEVTIMQDDLLDLLKLAETLQIKGLVDDHNNKHAASWYVESKPVFHSGNMLNITSNEKPAQATTNLSNNYSADSKNAVSFIHTDSFTTLEIESDKNKMETNRKPTVKLKEAKSISINYPSSNIIELNNNLTKDLSIIQQSSSFSDSVSQQLNIHNALNIKDIESCDTNKTLMKTCVSPMNPNYSVSNRTFENGNKVSCKTEVKSEPQDIEEPCLDLSLSGSAKSIFLIPPETSNIYKPVEWKRYKLYGNADLEAAITEVRAGVSAPTAARKHGIPSRTLYAKMKKLGIPTGPRKQNERSLLNFPVSEEITEHYDGQMPAFCGNQYEVDSIGEKFSNEESNTSDDETNDVSMIIDER